MAVRHEGRPLHLLSTSSDFSVQEPCCSCNDNDPYRVDLQKPYQQATHDNNPDVLPTDIRCLCHLETRRSDESNDSRTHTFKELLYPRIVLKIAEEHRYKQNDDNGGESDAQGSDDSTPHAFHLVADMACHIDGEDAWSGLCHNHDIDKLLLAEPMILVNELFLHDWYHGIAST